MGAPSRFFIAGAAGWALENLHCPEARYSKAFGGEPVPFLPVYGVGGVVLPELSKASDSTAGKFLTYAVGLTVVEWVAGQIDRESGEPSWDYGGNPVDLGHAALWGVLGLFAEAAMQELGVD